MAEEVLVSQIEVGRRVRQRRRALDFTQQDLADLCGCPYQVISALERGRQDVYARRFALIAFHLGVTMDYLAGLTNDMQPRRRGQTKRADNISEFEPTEPELAGTVS
jgi:transcriptional regulator with XRE-family HTH domain